MAISSRRQPHSLVWMFQCHVLERISLFVRASPLLPASCILLYFSSRHLRWRYIIFCSFVCLSPHTRMGAPWAQRPGLLCSLPHPCTGKSAWNRDSAHEYATSARMRTFLTGFVKASPLYSCSLQYISYNEPNKHLFLLLLSFHAV